MPTLSLVLLVQWTRKTIPTITHLPIQTRNSCWWILLHPRVTTVFWRLPRSYPIIIILSTFRLDHLNFLQSRCNINPRSSWWYAIASFIMFWSFLNRMAFFIIIIRKIFAWQILLLRSRILIFNQLLSSHFGFFVIG